MYQIIEEPLVAIKENWKRYLISSLVTFVSAFLLFTVPQMLSEGFSWDGIALYSLFLAGIRVGVKAVWEIAEPLLGGKK
jgi:hypothetical protein